MLRQHRKIGVMSSNPKWRKILKMAIRCYQYTTILDNTIVNNILGFQKLCFNLFEDGQLKFSEPYTFIYSFNKPAALGMVLKNSCTLGCQRSFDEPGCSMTQLPPHAHNGHQQKHRPGTEQKPFFGMIWCLLEKVFVATGDFCGDQCCFKKSKHF